MKRDYYSPSHKATHSLRHFGNIDRSQLLFN